MIRKDEAMRRKRTTAMIKTVELSGKCELCGNTENLEAHHIIPVAYGGPETEDNLICVCQACHKKLTPTSILVKKGHENIEIKKDILNRLWQRIFRECINNGYYMESVFDALESFTKEELKYEDHTERTNHHD